MPLVVELVIPKMLLKSMNIPDHSSQSQNTREGNCRLQLKTDIRFEFDKAGVSLFNNLHPKLGQKLETSEKNFSQNKKI